MQDSRVFCFASLRLDLGAECLWQADEIVRLTAKAFAVLRYLVEHAGRLVSKDELIEAVWAVPHVSDAALAVCIREIRRALQDSSQHPQFLETIRGRGYRFLAPVTLQKTVLSAAVPLVSMPPAAAGTYAAAPPAHLVGRSTELALLQECWTRAQQGERQVVFLTGEAGMGKTTLVDALVTQILGSSAGRYGHGQCVEQHGPGEAYLPLLEVLSRIGQGPEASAVLPILRRYAPTWLLHLPAVVTTHEAAALPQPYGGTSVQRMLRELTEAVEELTAEQPFVLVLEDLHWSDEPTLDWITYVAQRRGVARLLLVATYRPGDALVADHPVTHIATELVRRGQARQIRLESFSPESVEEYLAQRFGALPEHTAVAQAFQQRTAGHPFFLITAVDDLVQQGVIRHAESGWELAGDLQAALSSVPDSVRQMLIQQLERCAPEVQTVLQAASVAGTMFTVTAVAAATEQTVDAVETCCDFLVQRQQFLQSLQAEEWPDGTLSACYCFRHDLYREVLYERITMSRRIRWHRQIGTRLEAGYAGQTTAIAAELAEHFVRGHDPERAVPYLRYAGDQALARSAHREALQHYEQALKLVQQRPLTPDSRAAAFDLHLAMRTALLPLSDSARTATHMRAAEALAKQLGDRERQGQVAVYWTRDLGVAGHPQEAVAWGQRALALLPDNPTLRMTVQLFLSYAYCYHGNYQESIAILLEALEALPTLPPGARLGAAFPSAALHRSLVPPLSELGHFDEGIAHGNKAIQAATKAQHAFSLYQACRALASLYLARGDLQQAIPLLKRAHRLCEEDDLPYGIAHTVVCLGWAYAQAGDAAAALPYLDQGQKASTSRLLDSGHAPMILVLLSQGYLILGHGATAVPLAQAALELARERQERGFEAHALYVLGTIALQHEAPDVAAATRLYQQAMTLAQALHMRPLLAHLYYEVGILASTTEHSVQAITALATAVKLYRDMAMTFWLPHAEQALARLGQPDQPLSLTRTM